MPPISPFLVTEATKGLSAFRGGQHARQQQDLQNALQVEKLKQAAKEQAIKDALSQAHAESYRAQAFKARQPAAAATPPHLISHEGQIFEKDPVTGEWGPAKMAGAKAPAAPSAAPTNVDRRALETGAGDIHLDEPQTPQERGAVPTAQAPFQGGAPKFGPRPPAPHQPTVDEVTRKEAAELVAGGMSEQQAYETVRRRHPSLPAEAPAGNVFLPSVNKETGETTYTVAKNKGPVNAQQTEIVKPPTGGTTERAGMAAAFLSRLKMGKADFDNGMKFIHDYHQQLKQKNTITPSKMAASSAASIQANPEAHGITGLANNALGSFTSGFANKALGQGDPTYQRYVNLINSMSLAMTEVLPRPTQQILGIEKGINTVKAGDPPERIEDIQHRLDKAYEYLFADPEGMLRRQPSQPTGTPRSTITPAERAKLKARGFTDAQINALGGTP